MDRWFDCTRSWSRNGHIYELKLSAMVAMRPLLEEGDGADRVGPPVIEGKKGKGGVGQA